MEYHFTISPLVRELSEKYRYICAELTLLGFSFGSTILTEGDERLGKEQRTFRNLEGIVSLARKMRAQGTRSKRPRAREGEGRLEVAEGEASPACLSAR